MASQIEMGGQQVASSSPLAQVKGDELALGKRSRPGETVIQTLLLICGIVSIFTTLGIVYVLGGEAIGFFSSRAWVLVKAPVADEEPSAILTQDIEIDDTVLSISFEGERVPFNNLQFIQIGTETMRVVDRGRTTITVSRGQDGSEATAHTADADVFGMRDEQIKPLNDIDLETTTIELVPTFSREFEVGDNIQIDQEIMEVTAIDGDTLVVLRGEDGTAVAEHEANDETIEKADNVTFIEFISTTTWQPQIGNYGIWPLLLSTLIISFIALLVAIPLGLGAAIYLSEYAPQNVRAIMKPVLELLAGIPTVVFGFFALTFVTPGLQIIFGNNVQFYNMLSAGLVVGILIIPYISSISEDALNAVPSALRDASYGLGATRLETTVKIVLPAAISGILAAVILATSRVVGETMIVAIAAGSGPNFTFNVFEGAETMTGHIARISGGDLSYNSIDYNSIFAIGLTLFLMTLTLNMISTWVKSRLQEKY